jgi:hypothetical protein
LYFQVLTAAQYLAPDPEQNYLIVFAIVTPAVANVPLAGINTAARDEITPVGRDWFRGVVANTGLLPVPPPVQNLIGDHYYVTAANTFYFWTGAIWSPMTTSGYNSETILNNRDLVDNEIQRLINGSGVISGTRYVNSVAGFTSSNLDITITGTLAVNNSVDISPFSAVVYGHQVITRYSTVTLAAKPVVGNRYDLLFLEVWREAIAVPETHGYERGPTGALTYTLPQATTVVQGMTYDPSSAGDNFNFNSVGATAHAGYVVKWRIGHAENVGTAALYDPISGVAGWAIPNTDGVNFAVVPNDNRIWAASPSPTSIDGVTYALPLFVLYRHDAEDAALDPIVVYRQGRRIIFPVHPIADVAKLGRDLADTAAVSGPLSASLADVGNPTLQPNEKPSGFITGMNYQIGPGVAANTLKFYNESAKFRIRGFEDWTRFNVDEFDLLAAPAVGYTRTLIYIRMDITLYQWDDTDVANLPGYYTSRVHRPLIPNYLLAGVVSDAGQGWRRGFVTYQVVVRDFDNLDYRDADDAMAAAGWSKGDLFLLATNPELAYQDGGLWSRTVPLTVDTKIHPFLTQWAIPVALVHRRNQAAWTYNANPNGTGAGRPDRRTAHDLVDVDDLVDLRCTVDIDEGTLAKQLAADMDRNMKGQLRTRMANKWAGAGTGGAVAGTRVLQSDCIGGAAVPGTFALVVGDGFRTIWSDAKEFMPVSCLFSLDATNSNTLYSFNHVTGVLTLNSPVGAHIVRRLPAAFVAGGAGTLNYLQYNGPPLWSTRHKFDRTVCPYPTQSSAKVLVDLAGTFRTEDDLTNHAACGPSNYLNFDIPSATKDTYGRVTSMTYTMTNIPGLNSDRAALSWWVHYDRIVADADYADNYGLAEIPDEVHDIREDPLGVNTQLNNGPLYTVVRVAVAALDTSVTITEAMVRTASGTPGVTAKIVGIAAEQIVYSATPANLITDITMNLAQDSLVINYAGAIGAMDVDVIVFYYTTGAGAVTKWVEIGRGGKSISGPFTWVQEAEDITSAGGAATTLATAIKDWWKHVEVAGMQIELPIVWYKHAGAWVQARLHRADEWGIPGSLPLSAGYPFSNVISLSEIPAGADVELKIVVAAADATVNPILVHYTYTPYQGLSNSGGAVTNPIPAGDLTRIKSLLHGKVVSNSDWLVTQSGACSRYGGVDSWTGWPVREPDRYLNFQYSAFYDYNSPRLVRSRQQGLQDTFNRDYTNTNAAAVMRMPYPDDAHTVANRYRPHCHDLDPGREGVSCGWFSYAPAYYSSLTLDRTTPGTILTEVKRDQFVNGITPLSSGAFQYQEERSNFVGASDFTATTDPVNVAQYATLAAHIFLSWDFAATDLLCVDASIATRRHDVLCSTVSVITQLGILTPGGVAGDNVSNSQLLINTPRHAYGSVNTDAVAYNYLLGYEMYSWPNGWGGTENALLCHGCGTIDLYYKSMLLDTQPVLRMYDSANAVASTRQFYGTYTVIENWRAIAFGQNVNNVEAIGLRIAKPLDTVYMPWSSGSRPVDHARTTAYTQRTNYYDDSASTTLTGLNIAYPDSWDAATITQAETLLRASEGWNAGYGRGICLTNASGVYRFNMPVLLPGSGTPMADLFQFTGLPVTTAVSPPSIPVAPGESPFARSHRCYDFADHGGAMAYCCFGLHIYPDATAYSGRCVMQISGGPLGHTRSPSAAEYDETIFSYDETTVDGTALDAFWPTGRPVLKKR